MNKLDPVTWPAKRPRQKAEDVVILTFRAYPPLPISLSWPPASTKFIPGP